MIPNLDYKGIEFPVSKKIITRLNQKIKSVRKQTSVSKFIYGRENLKITGTCYRWEMKAI